jgi:4-hydroxythreonine-4-phosphate dehydrogenase
MIGITIGDPLGIGPEVILKSIKRLRKYRKNLLLIGSKEAFLFWNDVYSLGNEFSFVGTDGELIKKLKTEWSGFLVYDVGLGFEKNDFYSSAQIAIRSIDLSISLLRAGLISSIVNGPVSKENISKIIGEFKGHTWYYAKAFRVENYNMAFYSKDVRVVLVTEHVPLREVFSLITEDRLKFTINNTLSWLRSLYLSKERFNVGICGINPHAGEGGELGNEEEVILKVLEGMKGKMEVEFFGPLPPDTAFLEYRRNEFDAMICMYHDQGLIPFKLLHFEDGINVSLGFPFVRTTPDHGTGFSIAGKNLASYKSMLNAIKYNLLFENM